MFALSLHIFLPTPNDGQIRTKVIWQKAESLWQVHPTPRLYSPGGSIGLTVWPQFAIACFGWGFDPQNLPCPSGHGPLSNTVCHRTPQVYLPNDV